MKQPVLFVLLLVMGFGGTAHAQQITDTAERTDISDYTIDYHNFDLTLISEGIDDEFYRSSSFGLRSPLLYSLPVLQNFRYNRVDGLYLGIRKERLQQGQDDLLGIKNMRVHGQLGYAMGSGTWQYAAGLEKYLGEKQRFSLGTEYFRTTATQDMWRAGMTENTLAALSGSMDYFDYYHAEGLAVYSRFRITSALELGVSYQDQVFTSAERTRNYGLFGRDQYFRENPGIDRSTDRIEEESINLSLSFNIEGPFIQHGTAVRFETSDIPAAANAFVFSKWIAENKLAFALDQSSILRWRVMAGGITGDAPGFKQFALGGTGSLRAAGHKSLNGNSMLLSNLEIEFGQSKRVGNLNYPDLKHTRLMVFLDSGWTGFYNNRTLVSTLNSLTGNFRAEDLQHSAGFGVGFGFLRFEISRPLRNSTGDTTFRVRLNPTF